MARTLRPPAPLALAALAALCFAAPGAAQDRPIAFTGARILPVGGPPIEGILGVDKRVGSLERGKDGDLALFDSDPFEYGAHCVATVVNGQVVSEGAR